MISVKGRFIKTHINFMEFSIPMFVMFYIISFMGFSVLVRGAFKIKKLAKVRKFSQQGGGQKFKRVIPKFYLGIYLKGRTWR